MTNTTTPDLHLWLQRLVGGGVSSLRSYSCPQHRLMRWGQPWRGRRALLLLKRKQTGAWWCITLQKQTIIRVRDAVETTRLIVSRPVLRCAATCSRKANENKICEDLQAGRTCEQLGFGFCGPTHLFISPGRQIKTCAGASIMEEIT